MTRFASAIVASWLAVVVLPVSATPVHPETGSNTDPCPVTNETCTSSKSASGTVTDSNL